MDIDFEHAIICDIVAEAIFEHSDDLTARWKHASEGIIYFLFSFFYFLFFICSLFVFFCLSL